MQISSQFCRDQEAEQNQRAADSSLANIKTVALSAAAAWRLEGVAAERREQRRTRISAEEVVPGLDGGAGENADPDFDEST